MLSQTRFTRVASLLASSAVATVVFAGAAQAGGGDDDVWAEVSQITCPSAGQCSVLAVPQTYGRRGFVINDRPARTLAVSFDPAKPGTLRGTRIGGNLVVGIECASNSRCVAERYEYDDSGSFSPSVFGISFDPDAPGKSKEFPLGEGTGLVSCPAVSECIASLAKGEHEASEGTTALSFDPVTGAVDTRVDIPAECRDDQFGHTFCSPTVDAAVCPSTTQCTGLGAVQHHGDFSATDTYPAKTFNPKTGKVTGTAEFASGPYKLVPQQVVCVSATQCTASGSVSYCKNAPPPGAPAGYCSPYDQADDVAFATFDPTTGAMNSKGIVRWPAQTSPGRVACASATRCVMLLGEDHPAFVSYDPLTGETSQHTLPGKNPRTVACAGPSRCLTGVDIFDQGDQIGSQVVVFDPASGKIASRTPISLESELSAALKQCMKIENRAKRERCVKKANARWG